MPQLLRLLEYERPIYCAESAISQFELLLAQFGGPRERDRWRHWKERITSISNCKQSGHSPRIKALAISSSMTEVSSIYKL